MTGLRASAALLLVAEARQLVGAIEAQDREPDPDEAARLDRLAADIERLRAGAIRTALYVLAFAK